MLSTFTTKDGLLVIRSEDLRRIEDHGHGCAVTYLLGDDTTSCAVLGTAQENLDRLIAAEAQQLAAYAAMQQRADRGLPALPIVRGGKVKP